MKVIRIISTVVLSLFLGIAAFAWAQQEEKQDHPAQQQNNHDQAKPEQQQSQHAQQQQKQEQNKADTAACSATTEAGTEQADTAACSATTEAGNSTTRHSSTPSSNRSHSSMLSNSEAISNLSTTRNSSVSSRAHGNSIALRTGSQTTRLGNNVAATTDTVSPTTVSMDTLVRTTDSTSTACPSWLLADTHAFSIRAIGSVSLTHGRSTGETIGMTTTMSMSPTRTTAITFTTRDIPASESRSASRCNGVPCATSGGAAPLLNA